MTFNLDNAGLAFGLVVAAGLSTAVGAAAVYFNSLVKMASKSVLAAGLGFSGGVMLYVSFVEIFVKSQGAFAEAIEKESHAYMAATACLFAGMLLLRLMALLVHGIQGDDHCCDPGDRTVRSSPTANSTVPTPEELSAAAEQPAGAPEEPVKKDVKLESMGLKTALAIAIHNFPEGLATFVATLAEPSVGVMLAVAIAIHNIPEGLCVALPIFYSSGSRHKAFFWALLSGLSEPVGALVGYLIIKATGDDMNQIVYGVLFGLVAGMMIMIVILELTPTALRYDPQDKVVTNSAVLGMVVMALSLVLMA